MRNAPALTGLVLSILLLPAREVVVAQRLSPDAAAAGSGATATSQFVDPASGLSVNQLVQLALSRNGDLMATRQRTVEAQGLLRQAGFR
ncbi:MAG TPA: hypothetical protein VIZ32_07405, partial [Vicinamibacterales bacterium]